MAKRYDNFAQVKVQTKTYCAKMHIFQKLQPEKKKLLRANCLQNLEFLGFKTLKNV